MSKSQGTMTLAFELSALKGLRSPKEVFEGARAWSKYVGVITDEPTYVVTNYTRKKRIRQDFFKLRQDLAGFSSFGRFWKEFF